MLEIRDLHAAVAGEPILKGLNLTVNAGEVHAIMGPNGSGKSTLANVLAGKDNYEITGGDALFEGKSLADLEPEERAQLGLLVRRVTCVPWGRDVCAMGRDVCAMGA